MSHAVLCIVTNSSAAESDDNPHSGDCLSGSLSKPIFMVQFGYRFTVGLRVPPQCPLPAESGH